MTKPLSSRLYGRQTITTTKKKPKAVQHNKSKTVQLLEELAGGPLTFARAADRIQKQGDAELAPGVARGFNRTLGRLQK